jgi:hypothetical protein
LTVAVVYDRRISIMRKAPVIGDGCCNEGRAGWFETLLPPAAALLDTLYQISTAPSSGVATATLFAQRVFPVGSSE